MFNLLRHYLGNNLVGVNIMNLDNKEYIKDLLVRMAHHSTAIEGNNLTLAETKSILIDEYIPRQMETREYYEVKNYSKAIKFLEENNEKISIEKIKKYHKIIMEDIIENNGEFKKIQNIIVGSDFETTKPYQVPSVLKDWCDNLNYRLDISNSDEEKLRVILEEHINFEKIHPFSDGNGRTGRILIIDACIRADIIPIIIPKEQKKKYINILSTENKKEFYEWGLELQKKEIEREKTFKEQSIFNKKNER